MVPQITINDRTNWNQSFFANLWGVFLACTKMTQVPKSYYLVIGLVAKTQIYKTNDISVAYQTKKSILDTKPRRLKRNAQQSYIMKVLIFLVIASCPKVIRGQILRFDFNKTSVFNHIITIFCVGNSSPENVPIFLRGGFAPCYHFLSQMFC